MDHIRRGSLNLEVLKLLVLDEADEMLRMGFCEDVEWILEQTPEQRQLALFSATMPAPIRRIARKHMPQATEIEIAEKTVTVSATHQRYWLVPEVSKLEAATRLLETENYEAMLIFVRTRSSTVELAEQLSARGYAAAALNGDMPQPLRERMVAKLKDGALDILVATDVAARGLDVERISHVLNYDIPYDAEAYVHRIGRTGRAGRSGNALLFVTPREKHLLRTLERAIKQPIETCPLPGATVVTARRIERFKQQLTGIMSTTDLDFYRNVVDQLCQEQDLSQRDLAAALTFMAQREQPFQVKEIDLPKDKTKKRSIKVELEPRRRQKAPQERSDTEEENLPMVRYRLEVGRNHQVRPGDIVGAIANEAGIDGQHIGRIKLFEDYSTVDLPAGMPKAIFKQLRKTWVRNQQLRISLLA
jgi:ATP-dependent RNA helicase DeaD